MSATFHAKHYSPSAILAAEAVSLPAMAGQPKLPLDIQWAPPGTSTINCSQAGKPVRLTVLINEATAATVNAACQAMIAASDRGTGDRPYFDLNHNDEEASAFPSEFFWGGDDPVLGGVRARLTFSAAGATAILGKNYRRFSPAFFSQAGIVTGAGENMGGFVNRAAFKTIATVLAKEMLVADHSFNAKARQVAAAREIDLDAASEFVAASDSAAYDDYRASLNLGGFALQAKMAAAAARLAKDTSAAEQHSFYAKARTLAASREVDLGVAMELIAASEPATYDDYRASLSLGDHALHSKVAWRAAFPPEVEAEDPAFVIAAKVRAAADGTDLVDAFEAHAHDHPDDYQYLRFELGLGRYSEPPQAVKAQERFLTDYEAIATTIAASQRVDFVAACEMLAHTSPAFYASYHAAVTGNDEGAPQGAENEPLLLAARSISARRHVDLSEAALIAAKEQPALLTRFAPPAPEAG